MSYQVLARKWRPRTFQEMVGQEHVLRMLTNALEQNRLHHAYLFTGTRGVGKTTLGRIFAKCLNCEKGITATPCNQCNHCTAIDQGRFLDLLEIDAASRTKVEDTRELLDNIQYQPVQGRFKVYLIDEVHMLSSHSFNALLKTLEEPPSYVKFLLATTDPKRLPITILSRCLQLSLKRVPVPQITQHLEHICKTENIPYDMAALSLLGEAADGSLRDALSLLDQAIAFCNGNISLHEIRLMLGSIEQDALFRLLNALANKNGPQLLTEISQLTEYAIDFYQALDHLLAILHQISITQIIGDQPERNEHIKQFAKQFSPEDIQLFYQIALIGRRDLALAANIQQGFEMVMLRMLAFNPVFPETQTITPNPVISKSESGPITAENWPTILGKLNLTGMALALASNCTMSTMQENKMTLALSPQYQALCNKKLIERIEQALQQHFNKKILLDIQLITDNKLTPAQQAQEQQAAQKKNATDAIKNDLQVQKIMNIFNATLDENSIKSI
jgi:DNA polymerase-3 subunit gamma/tau